MRSPNLRSRHSAAAGAALLIALVGGPALRSQVVAANRPPAQATPLSKISRSAGPGAPSSRGRIEAAAP
jgi:hypothetical protein